MYVDLLQRPENGPDKEERFELEFKTDDEVVKEEEEYWYQISEFLSSDKSDLWEEIKNDFPKDKQKIANRTLREVYTELNSNSVINYYNYSKNDIESMLEMFIRTNDGGQQLKNEDMLLSIITEYWNRNSNIVARNEISEYVEEINMKYEKELISESFVMRNLLYCSDNDITFTLSNFTSDNITDMCDIWKEGSDYKNAYDSAINFLYKYNFEPEDLGGKFTLHLLIYYFYKTEITSFEDSNRIHQKTKKHILAFVCIIKIKGLYKSSSTQKLMNIRDGMIGSDDSFDITNINDNLKNMGVSLNIGRDFLSDMLQSVSYGDSKVKSILTLIYLDDLEYIEGKDDLHIDHIYPRSRLKKEFNNDENEEFESAIDTVCNLQYLTETENNTKNKTKFSEWLQKRTEDYKNRNKIPPMEGYSIRDYEEFIESRHRLILNDLVNKW